MTSNRSESNGRMDTCRFPTLSNSPLYWLDAMRCGNCLIAHECAANLASDSRNASLCTKAINITQISRLVIVARQMHTITDQPSSAQTRTCMAVGLCVIETLLHTIARECE